MSLAKFKAEIGTIAVGAKNVKVVLTMSKKDFFKNTDFFESEPEEVQVSLGDPQMTFDDLAREQGLKPGGVGSVGSTTSYNVQADGTVDRADKQDAPQGDLFNQERGDAPEESEGGDESGEPEEESDPAAGDAPEDFDDMDFGEEDGDANPNEDEEHDPEQEDDADPVSDEQEQPRGIDKEELEGFILARRPHFDDLPYDFPTLLERKHAGETWIDIAKMLGVSSSNLQSMWSKYKEKVKGLMMQGAA